MESNKELLVEKRNLLIALEAEVKQLVNLVNEEDRQERESRREDQRNRAEMDAFTARQAAYHRR